MKRGKKAAPKSNQLQKIQFRLLQKNFAKQRGYVHWPAVIVDFHPIKSYTAKVEFFGWNHQWAWISFNNLLEPKAAQKIVQNNIHRAKYAKAVNEMNIWRPPVVNKRILKEAALGTENFPVKPSDPQSIERISPRHTRSKAKLLERNNNNDGTNGIIEKEPTRVLRPRKR